jgi:hypothetical protein
MNNRIALVEQPFNQLKQQMQREPYPEPESGTAGLDFTVPF